jgi:oligoendopeptidase F
MTTPAIEPAPRWDLDSIFPGGSGSPQFEEFRSRVRDGLGAAERRLRKLPTTLTAGSAKQWTTFILQLQSLMEQIHHVRTFAGCLVAQDVADSRAHQIDSEGDLMLSRWQKLRTGFEALAVKQKDAAWKKLVTSPELIDIQFYLNRIRDNARRKMAPELESLVLDLSVDGYHAWNHIYDKMAGDLRADFEKDGQIRPLSMGQLATLMSNADREIRRLAFEKLTGAWKSRADLAAMMLNAQAGFRLSLYERRGWKSPLYEPLKMSRLRQESLDAMWHVVARETKRLAPYIEAKKKHLGIDKFRWYDEFAACGEAEKTYTFEEAGEFIAENVRSFSSDMADFYRSALDRRWVEAEDRAGKAGGGFCGYLPMAKQSRIFMTYAGTYENLCTLSHELGHAYHGYTLRDVPYFSRSYPMTLAETASIFSEMLVNDAALAAAPSPSEKLMLLDQILQQPYIFFTDLHSRYLFDRAFYEERRKGTVSRDRLDELMIDAQRRAYQGLLDESGYHPLFWCSKLHFFITDTPFYNFPYTFGYLFAGGVYARAREEGKSFAERYRALLRDTGRMTTEQAARKHLGVDLTKEEFWESAVDRSLSGIGTFVKLAKGA